MITTENAIEMIETMVLRADEPITIAFAGSFSKLLAFLSRGPATGELTEERNSEIASNAFRTKMVAEVPMIMFSSLVSKWFGHSGSSQSSVWCSSLKMFRLRPAVPIMAIDRHMDSTAKASVGVRIAEAMVKISIETSLKSRWRRETLWLSSTQIAPLAIRSDSASVQSCGRIGISVRRMDPSILQPTSFYNASKSAQAA